MKQYLTPDQTAKLIELGFDRPKFEIETQLCNIRGQPLREATIVGDYSIGELIEMLLNDDFGTKAFKFDGFNWWVDWNTAESIQQTSGVELIDALFDMVVQLRKEGVI